MTSFSGLDVLDASRPTVNGELVAIELDVDKGKAGTFRERREHAHIQTDRQTDRQTGRQTGSCKRGEK